MVYITEGVKRFHRWAKCTRRRSPNPKQIKISSPELAGCGRAVVGVHSLLVGVGVDVDDNGFPLLARLASLLLAVEVVLLEALLEQELIDVDLTTAALGSVGVLATARRSPWKDLSRDEVLAVTEPSARIVDLGRPCRQRPGRDCDDARGGGSSAGALLELRWWRIKRRGCDGRARGLAQDRDRCRTPRSPAAAVAPARGAPPRPLMRRPFPRGVGGDAPAPLLLQMRRKDVHDERI
ncbi:hypothetical protein ZWY2020_001858 [Hordeum vulgare]|nr:hypothetical protein ZWY2020_001858 [Hordeum vulgare]